MKFLIDLINFNEGISYKHVLGFIGIGIALIWLSIVIFVWCDSLKYFSSKFLRVFFTLITLLFGFAGLFIYILFKGIMANSSYQSGEDYKKCPKCFAYNDVDNKYCVNCGKKLFQLCKNCKAEIDLEDSYCWNCGKHLSENQTKSVNLKNHMEKKEKLRYIKSNIFSFFGRGFSVFKKKSSKKSK